MLERLTGLCFRKVCLAGGAAVLLLYSCSGPSAKSGTGNSSNTVHADNGRKGAPDFALQDANGDSVKLSSLRGKVVLLNFWATWCGPCQMEIPWFVGFEQQYRSKGLEVVGVSMDEDGWKVIKPYLKSHNVNYRVLLGNDAVTQLYGGVDSLPTTFLVDREGRIAKVHVGLAGKNEYQEEIQQLLEAGQSNSNRTSLHLATGLIGLPATKP